MANFAAPKVFVDATEITHKDWNSLISAAAASINNISDEQVGAAADIDASKLADGTVLGTRINDSTLETAKLGVNVAAVGVSNETGTGSIALQPTGTDKKVVEVQRSVLGGMVLVVGVVTIRHAYQPGVPQAYNYQAWLARNGTLLGANRIPFKLGGWTVGSAWITIPVIWIEAVASGLHTWTMNLKHVDGGGAGSAMAWQLLVWEWR